LFLKYHFYFIILKRPLLFLNIMKNIYFVISFLLLTFSALCQNHPPVAVADSGFAKEALPASRISLYVILNDYDPDGDSIKIDTVIAPFHGKIAFSDSVITYTTTPYENYFGYDSVYYRITERNDTTSKSEWVKVLYEIEQDSIFVVCINDTVSAYNLIPVTINVLANDYQLLGIPIKIRVSNRNSTIAGYVTIDSVGNLTITPVTNVKGYVDVQYDVYPEGYPHGYFSHGHLMVNVLENHTYDSLTVNNINAGADARGFLFSNNPTLNVTNGGDAIFLPHFEAPKSSGCHTIFTNTLWIAGKDESGQLHVAAEMYRTGPHFNIGEDFWAGPVTDTTKYTFQQDSLWVRLWKISKSDIDYHKAYWWQAGYQMPQAIKTWPGNGDVSLGQAANIASFFDYNNDGVYNPETGDYPIIRGDEAILTIYNDNRFAHNETLGKKLGVEIHSLMYAFDRPNDSAFNNTIFVHYDIFNRSQNTYDSLYLGIFTKLEIGNPHDDFLGSDVERGMFYGYNALDYEPVEVSTPGINIPKNYGAHPPAQGITVLEGLKMSDDGIDNPKYDEYGNQLCNESINGSRFGDTIIDNERMGLTGVYDFDITEIMPTFGDLYPTYDFEYYKILKGLWQSSSHLSYGSWGLDGYGAYGPSCNFMYPGNSDTLHWGSGCVPPNGPSFWTDNNPGGNHIRPTGVTGPITFHPGEKQEIDLAYTFARDYAQNTAWSSVVKLQQYVDQLRKCYFADSIPGGGSFSDIKKLKPAFPEIKIFPNPADDVLYVQLSGKITSNVRYHIVDLVGKEIISGKLNNSTTAIQTSNLKKGFYILTITENNGLISKKFIKK